MLDLQIMAAGYCSHPEFVTLKGGSWGPCRFPSLFALIRHPQRGYILYDTGYAKHMLEQRQSWTGKVYLMLTPVHCSHQDSAVAQLRAKGIAADAVRHIIISHFHADHIAGLRDFPMAQFWCLREAYDQVKDRTGFAALRRGFLPQLLPFDFEQRLAWVDCLAAVSLPSCYRPFQEAYDLFGDGTLKLVPLPGHAAGQLGLLLTAEDGRPTFLIGDAVWSERSYLEMRPPHPVTRFLSHSPGQYLATLKRLNQLSLAFPDLRIIPSHSRKVWQPIV